MDGQTTFQIVAKSQQDVLEITGAAGTDGLQPATVLGYQEGAGTSGDGELVEVGTASFCELNGNAVAVGQRVTALLVRALGEDGLDPGVPLYVANVASAGGGTVLLKITGQGTDGRHTADVMDPADRTTVLVEDVIFVEANDLYVPNGTFVLGIPAGDDGDSAGTPVYTGDYWGGVTHYAEPQVYSTLVGSDNTWTDSNEYLDLPRAGRYLLWFELNTIAQATGLLTSAYVQFRLYNATDGVQLTDSYRVGARCTVSGSPDYRMVNITTAVTVNGAKRVRLEMFRPSGPTWTYAGLSTFPAAGGIGYARLEQL